MGTDLILTHKGKEIAYLGRAYPYQNVNGEVKKNVGAISDEITERINSTITQISTYLGYHPLNPDDLETIQERVDELINAVGNELVEFGKQTLLATLLEEDEIGLEIK